MMKGRIRKWNNRGSAMLVAIVASMVVIAFSLSLLLVSYSLFASSIRRSTQTQCRELAKSISIELENEITTPRFNDHAQQLEAKDAGKYPLWFYLRDNMNNAKWPYYGGSEVPFHTAEYAYRYFDLDVTGGDYSKYGYMMDDISVCMYWTPDSTDANDLDNAMLTMSVTCQSGDQTCTIVSEFTLSVTEYMDVTGSDSERWIFSFEERE